MGVGYKKRTGDRGASGENEKPGKSRKKKEKKRRREGEGRKREREKEEEEGRVGKRGGGSGRRIFPLSLFV
jgi:hypothetical protein